MSISRSPPRGAPFDDGVWAKVSPPEKGRILWRIADLIKRDLEEVGELESIDNGKPYAMARVADLPLAVDMFRYMGGWATKITGRTIPSSPPGQYLSYTVKGSASSASSSRGISRLIAAWKIAPALAAGCTILDPATEMGPLVSSKQFDRVTG